MPLKAPQLDNRAFEQILRELQLRIPVYTPEWTDFNDSDPGMTLVQLFAWMTETTLFQLNQLPDAAYIKFLQLLGQELRPATPATAYLTFTTTPGTFARTVPARAQISAQPPEGGDPVIFETDQALDLIQADLTDLAVFEGAGFKNVSADNKTPGQSFRPFGHTPVIGNALYLGFKPPPPGSSLRVFPSLLTFRAFLPEAALAGKPQRCTGAPLNPRAPVDLVWEFRPSDASPWQQLNVFLDESLAFTREGFLRIEGPPTSIKPTIEPRLNAEGRYWLRCRIDGRAYETGTRPEIDFLAPNTVQARGLATVRAEPLGRSDGTAGQTFKVRRAPVLVEDANRGDPLGLTTVLNGDEYRWERRDDFLGSKAQDRHYTLNATSGELRFGDGSNGRIPEPDSEILATEYRTGGGKRGNVGPDLIRTPQTNLPGVAKVTNSRPAVGGAEEQSAEDLKEHAPQLLKRRDRAVTTDDFAKLVLEVGGVSKAVALAQQHPDHPGVEVPGAVTVVIVPTSTEKKPLPSSDLIRAVCRKLDQHRLITTEVYVKGPEYCGVRVEAKVEAHAYASFDEVTAQIIGALDQFLSPLSKDRKFGDDLVATELYNVIRDVEHVTSVTRLNVYVDGRPQKETARIAVPKDGLLFSETHTIVVVPEQNL